ncbi:MAG: hypothetical protein CMI53_02560 [Parcubacteria group bacterium]|jgi:hypothetical protein|nr:hypothetical protein [Parcubacteria group bacterium]|tara:strand:- start:2990 stop:3394 length:405 start_codon:yes stop_codon:yes gene_type:complete
MIEYFKYFFNPDHLLSIRPPAMSDRAITILLVAFTALIVVGILYKIKTKTDRDGLKVKAYIRLFHLGLTIGILGYVYVFFAWQGITLLAGRFWLIILLLIALVWLGFIGKYLLREAPKMRKSIDQKRNFEKYIP